MEGIHLIYGDRERHSFLGRQLRGLLLFCASIVAWLLAVGLSIFGRPLRQWIAGEFGPSPLVRGFWTVMLPVLGVILTMLVLALIYRVARPRATTWRSVLPGAAAGAILWWGVNLLFGILRSEDTVWTRLRRAGRGDRFDGMDEVLFDDRLFWRGLERRKRCTGRLILMHNSPARTPPLFSRLRQWLRERRTNILLRPTLRSPCRAIDLRRIMPHRNEIVMVERSERIVSKQNGSNRLICNPLKRGVE
jgi:hypothetical protein